MAQETPLFVARETDLAALQAHWQQAKQGSAQFLRLQAPFGGGRRALSGSFFRALETQPEPPLLWRTVCVEQENGVQWLVRMYGSLVAALTQDVLTRGRVEMVLNGQLPSQPARVQAWYREFITTLKDAKTDPKDGSMQLRLPRDNPLVGLVEIVAGIARKLPLVVDLQNIPGVFSVVVSQFLEALIHEASQHPTKLLVILHEHLDDEMRQMAAPAPLVNMLRRTASQWHTHRIEPWGEAEVAEYLRTKQQQGDAARLAQIASGRPGFIAELIDILGEQGMLDKDLTKVSLGSLVPLEVDAGELDLPAEPPAEGKRKPAGPDDAQQVAQLAALMGPTFPSIVIAQMGGFTSESVDDLLDAMPSLFKEVQFSKELNSWVYTFTKGTWREGILERNQTQESIDVARRVGMFLERHWVHRGYGFVIKALRIYAHNQAPVRANLLRAMALGRDAPEAWGLAHDLMQYFDEIAWPDVLYRTVYTNLIDQLVSAGPVEQAEQLLTEATTWANNQTEAELSAWLVFANSRLDARRQALAGARLRAEQALSLYGKLDNANKQAEIHNHLAAIEWQDGNPNAALEHANQAMSLATTQGEDGQKVVPPAIFAKAEQVRGLVKRQGGDPQGAAEHFGRANEIAGKAGLTLLALDSGLGYGEAKLAAGQTEAARQTLGRVVQIARQLETPPRERAACELAAQAEGSVQNWPKAIEYASRVLALSQHMQLQQALPIDYYNLGFFTLASGKATEALALFRQAEPGAKALGNHPLARELHFFMGQAALATGDADTALTSLQRSIELLAGGGDAAKHLAALDLLARAHQHKGQSSEAKQALHQALELATKAGLKDQRKALKKKLAELS